MEFTKAERSTILENALSWIVVFAMFVYGFGKFWQFNRAAGVDTIVSEMTGMELMWAFYGYSHAFAIVLGILEVTGGMLLLFRKTRLLGCFFLTAILANIILQDIFYGVHLGALKAAILYQVILLWLMWRNREKLLNIWKTLTTVETYQRPWKRQVLLLFLAFLLFVALRVVEYFITIKL